MTNDIEQNSGNNSIQIGTARNVRIEASHVFGPGIAPPLPSIIIGRENDLDELKKRILDLRHKKDLPIQVLTAIRGWPGIGKTTIASVLAYDKDVTRFFADGILWTSLGPTPDLYAGLANWGYALGNNDIIKSKTIEEASALLSGLLRNKKMLLIIDDVWEPEHAMPFRVGGSSCAILVTTRSNKVANSLTTNPNQVYRLPVLSHEKSLELLSALAPFVEGEYPNEAQELVQELEGLPLALQVAGRMLNAERNYGFSVIELLKELRDGTRILEAKAPVDRANVIEETTPTVAALLQMSTERLDKTARDYFAFLGVFAPKPASFDLAALKTIWQIDDPKPIIRTLVDRGLLEPISQTERYQMHALLVAHAKSLLT